tara:strand:+ start:19 stop:420 length:402 start_codon:yes stop_codon:yes gene_type:complete
MKTPKEINKIYDRLPKQKVELNATKVELGVLDDLKKYSKGLSKYESEGEGLVARGKRLKEELSETQSAIYKWSDLGKSIADDAASDLVKFEKAAKELGIKPGSVKEFTEAQKAFKTYATLDQKYQKIAKDLLK